jgi:hypothetical protein
VTLFRQSGAGFVKLTLDQAFVLRIAEQMLYHTGRRAAPAKLRSWDRSLPVLAQSPRMKPLRAGSDDLSMPRLASTLATAAVPKTRLGAAKIVRCRRHLASSLCEG